jgi:hypothetical protein
MALWPASHFDRVSQCPAQCADGRTWGWRLQHTINHFFIFVAKKNPFEKPVMLGTATMQPGGSKPIVENDRNFYTYSSESCSIFAATTAAVFDFSKIAPASIPTGIEAQPASATIQHELLWHYVCVCVCVMGGRDSLFSFAFKAPGRYGSNLRLAFIEIADWVLARTGMLAAHRNHSHKRYDFRQVNSAQDIISLLTAGEGERRLIG